MKTKRTIEIAEKDTPEWVRERLARGWEVWNASRPLLGTERPSGAWAGSEGAIMEPRCAEGVFYAAIDPADSFADRFRSRNVDLDGGVLVMVTEAAARAQFEAMCAERGITIEEILESWSTWQKAARSCGVAV